MRKTYEILHKKGPYSNNLLPVVTALRFTLRLTNLKFSSDVRRVIINFQDKLYESSHAYYAQGPCINPYRFLELRCGSHKVGYMRIFLFLSKKLNCNHSNCLAFRLTTLNFNFYEPSHSESQK